MPAMMMMMIWTLSDGLRSRKENQNFLYCVSANSLECVEASCLSVDICVKVGGSGGGGVGGGGGGGGGGTGGGEAR